MKYLLLLAISLNFYSKVKDIKHFDCHDDSGLIKVKLVSEYTNRFDDDYDVDSNRGPLQVEVQEISPVNKIEHIGCDAWINGQDLNFDMNGDLSIQVGKNKETKVIIASALNSQKAKSLIGKNLGFEDTFLTYKLAPTIQFDRFDVFHVHERKWSWGGELLIGEYHDFNLVFHRISISFDGEDSLVLSSFPKRKKIWKKINKIIQKYYN